MNHLTAEEFMEVTVPVLIPKVWRTISYDGTKESKSMIKRIIVFIYGEDVDFKYRPSDKTILVMYQADGYDVVEQRIKVGDTLAIRDCETPLLVLSPEKYISEEVVALTEDYTLVYKYKKSINELYNDLEEENAINKPISV